MGNFRPFKINPITGQLDLIGESPTTDEIVSGILTNNITTDGENKMWIMPYNVVILDVYLNGQLLAKDLDYSITKNSSFLQTKIQFSENQQIPTSGETILVKYVELEIEKEIN